MYIIDGKQLANELKESIKNFAKTEIEKYGAPKLAMIVVGNNPASATYVRNKKRALEEVGFEYEEFHYDEDVTESKLIEVIQFLNGSEEYHGIFVQFPLPKHLNEQYISGFIHPDKDVDGFTDRNVAGNVKGTRCFIPCTAKACDIIIDHAVQKLYGSSCDNQTTNPTLGAHVVIIGRSDIVGKPLSHFLTNRNYTVTVCHSKTPKDVLTSLCRQASVVVVAAGVPNLLTAEMVKPGAIVIDVGINFIEIDGKRKMVGDVDFENIKDVAGAITPVPGGVGPLTVANLVGNLYSAYSLQISTK